LEKKEYSIGQMAAVRFQPGIACLKSVVLWTIAIALSALPIRAQKGAPPPGGSGGSSGWPPIQPARPPVTQPVTALPTMEPLPKPLATEGETCLPWALPGVHGATVGAVQLRVPGKARSQYEKACGAFKKKKLNEAEQHARDAIQLYSNYSAAWVMLGQVLQDKQKLDEAHDACSKPLSIDPAYLPSYLCLAGLLNRENKWDDLLAWSNRFLGMNQAGDMYAYYYRGVASFHLHDLPEAQKNILQAIAIDGEHHQPGFNFLLAQIYGVQGDLADAALQIQQILKFSNSRSDKDAAREYLSLLESQQAPPAPASIESVAKTNSWAPPDIDRDIPQVAPEAACPLADVLSQAGERVQEFVGNVDRFAATEVVEHQGVDKSGQLRRPETRKFSYLVSITQSPKGILKFAEYRDGGSDADQFPDHFATVGTPGLVLIFHPLYSNDFNMTCEGLGQWQGQPAWQVRFEERTDTNAPFDVIATNVGTFRLRLRGRAWILADSFQIVHLQTDLAAQIPEIRVLLQHQDIEYRPVHFEEGKTEMWLPSTCDLYIDFRGHRFYRRHRYTDFKVFSVGLEQSLGDPKK
jgi:tetratricopeptide (TPR) repeat protein